MRPEHFAVSYAINPWMDPTATVDRDLAMAQWEALRQTYLDLGHQVELIEPDAGPARHGLRRQRRPGRRAAARSAPGSPTRSGSPRARPTCAWLSQARPQDTVGAVHVNEGEGDFLVVGGVILAGTGFRTDPRRARRGAGAVRPAGRRA